MGQSGRQGHGAPGKVKKTLENALAQKTGRNYRSLIQLSKIVVFVLEKLMSHHFCHILVDQNDINIISSNEALEGVLQ